MKLTVMIRRIFPRPTHRGKRCCLHKKVHRKSEDPGLEPFYPRQHQRVVAAGVKLQASESVSRVWNAYADRRDDGRAADGGGYDGQGSFQAWRSKGCFQSLCRRRRRKLPCLCGFVQHQTARGGSAMCSSVAWVSRAAGPAADSRQQAGTFFGGSPCSLLPPVELGARRSPRRGGRDR